MRLMFVRLLSINSVPLHDRKKVARHILGFFFLIIIFNDCPH